MYCCESVSCDAAFECVLTRLMFTIRYLDNAMEEMEIELSFILCYTEYLSMKSNMIKLYTTEVKELIKQMQMNFLQGKNNPSQKRINVTISCLAANRIISFAAFLAMASFGIWVILQCHFLNSDAEILKDFPSGFTTSAPDQQLEVPGVHRN